MKNMLYSFEFFPPTTKEGYSNFITAQNELKNLKPEFFSFTYGASGASQEKTFDVVRESVNQFPDIPIAPHITCIGSNKHSVINLLQQYQSLGINRLVVLRGDFPVGYEITGAEDFHYAADLVRFIRQETGKHFHISVASYPEKHPQAQNLQTDIKNFSNKLEAGADMAITQFVFNADAYYFFVEAAKHLGVNVPIVPGILPINKFSQICRFASSCGSDIPKWLKEVMGDATELQQRAIGVKVVQRLCRELKNIGAPSLHFYTLNRSTLLKEIIQGL